MPYSWTWKDRARNKAYIEGERAATMTENYAKAQRDKRDFDRNMKILARENKMKLHLINTEKQSVSAGLLDLQSKSKNLSDTMQYISSRLQDEKHKAEEQLTKMSIERSNNRTGVGESDSGDSEIIRLRQRIGLVRDKLEWSELPKKKATVEHSLKVMDLLTGKNQGFGKVLHKIREKKEEEKAIEETEKQAPQSPKDIGALIDHFKTLPKIYPSKPKKRRPKPTERMIEKYTERKKERDKAMTYVTRKRLRRVEFHFETIKELFLVKAK
ncbi:uncharacterized protein [Watersipora subatra]|uniref:uncharacterized protein n=1 Tax=Watersipora subatra TaxID=2589382 RepID=UPI00355B14D2